MKRAWTQDEIDRLRSIYLTMPAAEVAKVLGRSTYSVMSKASELRLGRTSWTTDEDDVIRRLYPACAMAEIKRLLARSPQAIRQRACVLGVKRIQSPDRKDAHRQHSAFMKDLRRRGYRNSTVAPVGTDAVQGGRVYRKVSDTGESSVDWKLAHRVIWEELHGSIPPGHSVVFIDGNRLNLDPENLELISAEVRAARFSITRYPREYHRTAVALGHFKAKLKKLESMQ